MDNGKGRKNVKNRFLQLKNCQKFVKHFGWHGCNVTNSLHGEKITVQAKKWRQ